MLRITDDIEIPDDALEERFVRSPGAGGQNVNKVATAVQLRFDASGCDALSAAAFQRLKRLAGSRMTQTGTLVITARRFRTQDQNRKDARARLVELIQKALTPPKVRRPTRTSAGQKQKRLDEKKRAGAVKKSRGRVSPDRD